MNPAGSFWDAEHVSMQMCAQFSQSSFVCVELTPLFSQSYVLWGDYTVSWSFKGRVICFHPTITQVSYDWTSKPSTCWLSPLSVDVCVIIKKNTAELHFDINIQCDTIRIMNVSEAKLLFLSSNVWGQLLSASPNESSQVFLCAFEGQRHHPRRWEKKKMLCFQLHKVHLRCTLECVIWKMQHTASVSRSLDAVAWRIRVKKRKERADLFCLGEHMHRSTSADRLNWAEAEKCLASGVGRHRPLSVRWSWISVLYTKWAESKKRDECSHSGGVW